MSNLSATNQIINYIKENILSGNFKINSKLPSERKIAEQFNISRIPVRKAIEKLCDDGILMSVPYSSPIVKGFKKVDLFNDNEIYKNHNIQEFYVESLRARQFIESEATKLAVLNASDEEIERIRVAYLKSIAELDKVAKGLIKECSDADLKFHKEIIAASHNPLFYKYYEIIPKTIFSNQYFGFKYRTSLNDMIEHHDKIMEAFEKRDPILAYNAMYNHLEDVIQLFQSK
ncbi:FadR family transcriptional regulator [Clostridium sp. NSJ-6]|uniref:FadR family transcriptional regulator n=1 Tax=Clostridium hominis TaxID=2763036 RepID=A0ABR7DE34_9CLOT|nr:FCD domain-containing protein [Clostridium hominis]MBC5629680.1 FadR family transcriptional regulator [Clostridium hominis]MDU2673545.1 FCD domain-containing protein [Clostridium sp.]